MVVRMVSAGSIFSPWSAGLKNFFLFWGFIGGGGLCGNWDVIVVRHRDDFA